ncbi:MAG: hypothetical protein HYZ86_01325 [Candidatus Omnitrophica bacterium]|nr:hypothetical protein [Candidatus Omnitrophota bacterium]
MVRGISGKKGQSSLPEYVVTFFLVIAAVVAMTVYIQRSIQAKTKDARDYMVGLASAECDDDCRAAAGIGGNTIPGEYEPYYGKVDSRTSRNSEVRTGLVGGTHIVNGQRRLFDAMSRRNETVETTSHSEQLPPGAAAGDQYGK